MELDSQTNGCGGFSMPIPLYSLVQYSSGDGDSGDVAAVVVVVRGLSGVRCVVS